MHDFRSYAYVYISSQKIQSQLLLENRVKTIVRTKERAIKIHLLLYHYRKSVYISDLNYSLHSTTSLMNHSLKMSVDTVDMTVHTIEINFFCNSFSAYMPVGAGYPVYPFYPIDPVGKFI